MLTHSLPNVAKGKFQPNFQSLFSKILRNKQHRVKVPAESFHLNGHIMGFCPQTQKLVTLQISIKHSGSERVKRVHEIEENGAVVKLVNTVRDNAELIRNYCFAPTINKQGCLK